MSERSEVIMQGRRVYDTDSFKPGDYGRHPADGTWYGCTPNGMLGNLSAHEVIEHEDGTITASPSILVTTSDSKGHDIVRWHGFLEHGVWREV